MSDPIPEVEWLTERLDNCVRIADLKTGDDRDSWLEDADYFNRIIEHIAALQTQVQQLRETTLEEAASHIENASVYSAYEEIAKIHAKWVRSLAATEPK